MPKIEFRDHHHMAKNHLAVKAIGIFIQGAFVRLSETRLRWCLEFRQAITGQWEDISALG